MNGGILYSLLKMTAWHMDEPRMFGGFHVAASAASALLAFAAAVTVIRCFIKPGFFLKAGSRSPVDDGDLAGRGSSDCDTAGAVSKVLTVTGSVLLIIELYKQLFLFHIVNDGAFDWWFFPFQLCSVPMYLCILLPVVKGRLRGSFLTFMCGYTFISAAAALIFPEDYLRPYVSLTLHGFIWHGILLFISLVIILTGAADTSAKGLLRAAALFAVLSAAAVFINIGAEAVMPGIRAAHPAVAHSWAAMFYMNPYHISPQPVVSAIQKTAGIPAGLMLYALVTVCAGSLVCRLAEALASALRSHHLV